MSFLVIWITVNGCLISLLAFEQEMDTKVSATTIIVDDDGTIGVDCNYTHIQWAIENASNGDSVFVKSGTYYENIVVNITIDLIGENWNTTIIDGNKTGDVVKIKADSVKVKGFTITNGGGSGLNIVSDYNIISNNNISNNKVGVVLNSTSNNNMITNNEISHNEGAGIYVSWIWISGSNQHTIANNNISYNYDGITLDASLHNTITKNNISNNEHHGIHLEFSSYNYITDNNITNNRYYGINLYVMYFFSLPTEHNTIINNRVLNNGDYGIALSKSPYNTISNNIVSDNEDDGISLSESSNNTISNNIMSNNLDDGISLSKSYNNIVTDNNVSDNSYGIYLIQSSNNNTISDNNILKNYVGISLGDSSGNEIFHNNFISNVNQADDNTINGNQWNNSYPSGGNFWSDYDGIDLNSTPTQDVPPSDGIGDKPYVIDANSQDNYPLMKPVNDTIPPSIEGITANPNIQEIGGNVNVSAKVTDDIQLHGIWAEISDPDGNPVGNFSMVDTAQNDKYYFTKTYSILGNYTFTIWACDKSDNWNSVDGIFFIQDTTAPTANAGADIVVINGTEVTFDASASSDNDRIDNYTWNFNYDDEAVTFYGVNHPFEFEIIGNYSVILTVTDPSKNSANDTMWVNVTAPDIDMDGEKTKEDKESFLSNYWWIFLILAIAVALLFLLVLKSFKTTSKEGEIEEYSEEELKNMSKNEILQIAKDRDIKTLLSKSKIIKLILSSQKEMNLDKEAYYEKETLNKMKKSEIVDIAREMSIGVTKTKEKLIKEILVKQEEIE